MPDTADVALRLPSEYRPYPQMDLAAPHERRAIQERDLASIFAAQSAGRIATKNL
jgi:hypothetical protein